MEVARRAGQTNERASAGQEEVPTYSEFTDTSYSSGRSLETVIGASSDCTAKPAMEKEREPSWILQAQLFALLLLQGADGVLLGCVFMALRVDLGLQLTDLSFMGVVQSMSCTLAAPVWAALADSPYFSRKSLLIIGALGQGGITLLLGVVTWWIPMIGLRALNGVFLAALGPIINGVIADHTAESNRGKVYGRAAFATQCGSFVTSIVATGLSRQMIMGLHGWRVVFACIGIISMVIGTWVAVSMDLPRVSKSEDDQQGGIWLVWKEARRVARFFKVPTFNVLILQGLFGMIGMNAGGFQTMYFQMVGITDAMAGTINSAGTIAVGFGVMMGGYVGDYFASKFRHHGRVLVAELSLLLGIPLKFVVFWGIAPFDGNWVWYTILTVAHGLFACWVTAGAKMPLLSEIVPQNDRSSVMAWDGTIESLSGSLLGLPMVTFLAHAMFGFDDKDVETGVHSENARALGHAAAVMICGPALVSMLCWILMHWSYPRDRQRIANAQAVTPTEDKMDSTADQAL